jgi:fumarate reductase flavoprotein subunit
VPRTGASYQPFPIVQGPFHAVPICAGITYTMGGILTDEKAQVLDEAGQPIAGLLAAGATTGGLEGGSHAGYSGGLSKASVFGIIAAETLAATLAPQD